MLSSKQYVPSSLSIDLFLEELCVPKKYIDDVVYFSYRDKEFTKLMDAPILADWETIPERLSENVYLFVPEWTTSSPKQWDWWQNRLLFCPPLTLRIGGKPSAPEISWPCSEF